MKLDYPELSIESANTKIATYLPNPFYVKLIPNTDLFHIYDDFNATNDIGHKFLNAGSLIVDPSVNYTVHVLNTGATNPNENIRRFMSHGGIDERTNVYFNQDEFKYCKWHTSNRWHLKE